jgi:cyanophycinase
MIHRKPKGKLIIIGGAEKNGDGMPILEAIAKEVKSTRRPLLLITAASYAPHDGIEEYVRLFDGLGVSEVDVLDLPDRADGHKEKNVKKVEEAGTIFFTGGDQLRITSQMADSPVYRTMFERYIDGCMIAGTSAGAAAMPDTMIIGGPSEESNRISALSMAPGLGLIEGVVIDSHFAERGRMGRLIGAVVQNPSMLGIGIDESTAILVDRGGHFTVIGAGAVYIVDGAGITYSSLSEESAEDVVTVHGVTLHVLANGEKYSLAERQPEQPVKQHQS